MSTLPARCAALMSAMALFAGSALAEKVYVTDELVVGIYAQADLSGDRLALVRSADQVDTITAEGDSTYVELADGTQGWVKTSYLVSDPPLSVRVQTLEAENKQLRSAARPAGEMAALQKANAGLKASLEAAEKENERLRATPPAPRERPADEEPVEAVRPKTNGALRWALILLGVAVAGVGGGFAWGYVTLDRRIRRKYGGLKVY